MSIIIANKVLDRLKAELLQVSNLMQALTSQIKAEHVSKTLKDITAQIEQPFLFVIVGEVKAGKSSFINALLDSKSEICKVAPGPMTDSVQQIIFGEEISETYVNPSFKIITHPTPLLKDISVVDTPGTNTIVEKHQEITERFIPKSDLIVFVFEAKNPYRESAWTFLKFIKEEWRKKIVFVLQQKDLLSEQDLSTNIAGVVKYAQEQGINEPRVFATSALEKQKGNIGNSGFVEVNNFISTHITGGQAPYLKLASINSSISNLKEKISASLVIRKKQLELDRSFRNNIREYLSHKTQKISAKVETLVDHVILSYDNITLSKLDEVSKGLSFFSMIKRSFSSIFGTQENVKDWLDRVIKEFEYKLNFSLKSKLQDGVLDIAEGIQEMAVVVGEKLKTNETILRHSDEIFSDIADKRADVLKDLHRAFADFLNDPESFYDKEVLGDSDKIASNMITGGSLAAIGMILTAITNGVIFDITGGILTAFGLLFAGTTIGRRKRKIMRSLRSEVAKAREKIITEVSNKLQSYTLRVKDKIESNFDSFDLHLEKEERTINDLNIGLKEVTSRLESNEKELLLELDKLNN